MKKIARKLNLNFVEIAEKNPIYKTAFVLSLLKIYYDTKNCAKLKKL